MDTISAQEEVCSSGFFEKAERKFVELTLDLQRRQTQALDFSDLEKKIEKDGRELLRLLLEAHLQARGDGDVGSSVEGADHIFRTHRRIGERQIKSIFGVIELKRLIYGGRGEESLFPKDAHLNLPSDYSHSHEVQRRVALEVIKGSFDQATESVSESMGMLIFKQQVDRMAIRGGHDFETFYQKNLSEESLAEAKLSSRANH